MEIKKHTQQTHYILTGVDGEPMVVSRADHASIIRIGGDEHADIGTEDTAFIYVEDIPKLITLLQAAYEQKGSMN